MAVWMIGRKWAYCIGLLLVPVVAGCLGGPAQNLPLTVGPIEASLVSAPGATIVSTPVGALITWLGPIELEHPFQFTIPLGVNRVDAVYTRASPDSSASIALYNAATDRIRCQPESLTHWNEPFRGVGRCSGVAVVDPLPATWRSPMRLLEKDARLEVRLSTEPLDGQAAQIRLDQLSMPIYAEHPTQATSMRASVDGAAIHVEYTLPETEEKVPTILISSPYNHATRVAGLRAQNASIADWVPRGYAVVVADVRGYGDSSGCVDVWGIKEQQDQYDLVEWVAEQPWSNGKVGFYGQSYVGTTPVEAASLGAPHLTTILTVAPVINAYEDWHFGGVPNGENTGSPIGYQTQDTNSYIAQDDPLGALNEARYGLCDPTMTARANDPRGVYDTFYAERDFKSAARNVKASVFYTQGFIDSNVKSQMIPGWFDELAVPKKGLFGDWVHQHPPRADQELLFHAWLDQWLMERDTGILETPVVEVRTNLDTVRTAETWPPANVTERRFGLDLSTSKILAEPAGSGSARYLAQSLPADGPAPDAIPDPVGLVLEGSPLEERLYVSGSIALALRATLTGATNTHFYAGLYDVGEDGKAHLAGFGMLNAALRNGYSSYQPVLPGETIEVSVPFLPTEYVFEAGHRLRLEVRSADVEDWYDVQPTQPGFVTLEGGEATALVLPLLPWDSDMAAPWASGPAPTAIH